MTDSSDIFADLNLEPQPTDSIDFDHILVIGRNFSEYSDMFLLEDRKPSDGAIMNVGGGVSSFTVEAAQQGFNILSGDPVYCIDPDVIEEKCVNDIECYLINHINKPHLYNWGHPFLDVAQEREARRNSYKMFLEDFRENRWRYLDALFPYTPFIARNNFSLSLVSHLLFVYEKFIDYKTHVKIIKEILRITSDEVRIYPLINLQLKTPELVGRIMEDPGFDEVNFELRPTRYNFIKAADKMMVIKKTR
jgi:hypothetical protein